MAAKFINPFTDFGFKKLFGEEASKPLLKDFLNTLLPPESQIHELSFQNREKLGPGHMDRRAIYDIHCISTRGNRFIVEMQKAKQNFFKDRTVYYSTFPIQEQAEQGEWNYQLSAVFCIGVLDFTFDSASEVSAAAGKPKRSAKGKKQAKVAQEQEEVKVGDVLHTIKLKNQHNQVFYDKLTFIYLEMPHFQKTEEELETRLDQWLYFLKHLKDFEEIPRIFGGEEIFTQAFKVANLAALGPEERSAYQGSLKTYWDMNGVIEYAKQEGEVIGLEKGLQQGREEGRQQGREETRREVLEQLIQNGMSEAEVKRLLGL